MDEDNATESAAKVMYESLSDIGLVTLPWEGLEPEDQDMFKTIVSEVISEYDSSRVSEDID